MYGSGTFATKTTIVHHDSLLNYVLNSPERNDFIKNRFPAVLSFPERMDLWGEFENIYKTYKPTDEELEMVEKGELIGTPNELAAMSFYESNKEEMDRGIKTLWESRFPFASLMLQKIALGTKAFNTEFMNNPIDEENQLFKSEEFAYYDQGITFNHRDFDYYMGIDFAMGKERGDFSVIVTLAVDKKTKKAYVYDVFCERVHPDQFLKAIVEKVIDFQPTFVAAEAQMAQEFFVDQLTDALQSRGYPRKRVKKIKQRQRKELRIEAMHPEIERGDIVFNRNHSQLLEQMDRFGSGWFDDCPDALQMALQVSKNSKTKVTSKPKFF